MRLIRRYSCVFRALHRRAELAWTLAIANVALAAAAFAEPVPFGQVIDALGASLLPISVICHHRARRVPAADEDSRLDAVFAALSVTRCSGQTRIAEQVASVWVHGAGTHSDARQSPVWPRTGRTSNRAELVKRRAGLVKQCRSWTASDTL
jgi:hypothetical protein